MSEVLLGLKRAVAVGGLLVGVGSTALLGKALTDHEQAEPAPVRHNVNAPFVAKVCINGAQADKPNCKSDVTGVAQDITTVYRYNDAALENYAENEAIIGGVGLAAALSIIYATRNVYLRPEPADIS